MVTYNDPMLWQMKSEPWTKGKFVFMGIRIEIRVSYKKKTRLIPQKIVDHFYQTHLSH